jgi:hypothetical protein
VGGNFRYIQTQLENNNFELRRSFAMQRDLEIAAKWDRFSLVTSYGLIYKPNAQDEVDLRRFYGLFNFNDELSLRAGRFLPTFGIMTNDHYLSVKQRLQFGQLTERDTVELNYISESWSAHINHSEAPDSKINLNQEQAVSVGLNYNVNETARVGFNYWYGDQKDRKRDITGVHALIGLSKNFYSLSELDYQVLQLDSGAQTKGQFFYQRFGYEFTRGVHALVQLDAAQTNLSDDQTKFYAFGSGITFYPRPHFELQLVWSRPKFKAQEFSDSAFLIFHYYL